VQIDIIKRYALTSNLDIVFIFHDVKSGSKEPGFGVGQRPGLQRGLDALELPNTDGLIVLDDSRLARDLFLSMKILRSIKRLRKMYISITDKDSYVSIALIIRCFCDSTVDNSSRNMIQGVKAVYNEFMRAVFRERAITSYKERLRKCVATSLRAPYGKRFMSILLNGTMAITKTMIPKTRRNPGLKPILVTHFGENAQMEVLREHLGKKPRELYEVLVRKGMATNWRNLESPFDVSNLGKSLKGFVKREQDLKELEFDNKFDF
jgi:hypothetical protein